MSTTPNHNKNGQIAKWIGAGVSALLVALLFRGCSNWSRTIEAPKVETPVINKVESPITHLTKTMNLTGANVNGKFTLNGVVPTDTVKAQIESELKKIFGDGNYINNLTVMTDVKSASWVSKITGLFDFFKLPGAEVTFNGETVTLSGTAGSLREKLQAYLGDGVKVESLDINASTKTANGNALEALNALNADASGEDVLSAMGLQIINFSSSSTAIPPENQAVLKKAAEFLKTKKDFKFEIAGHADNVGKANVNMTLSDKRAQAVRDFLIANGVPETMLTAKGYGDVLPVADNTTETGRLKNRRIEYKVK